LKSYDLVKERTLKELDMDPSLFLQEEPPSYLEANLNTETSHASSSAPIVPVTQYSTASAEYLRQFANIEADLLSLGGSAHHLFMSCRLTFHWVVGITDFDEAERQWKDKVIVENNKEENISMNYTIPFYDHTTLKHKCMEIENKQPKYLERWQRKLADGIMEGTQQDGTPFVTQQKIDYWKMHDLRHNNIVIRKKNGDVCQRCLLPRCTASAHPKSNCLDGVKVGHITIPYPQPQGLFIFPSGALCSIRFNALAAQLKNRNREETMNQGQINFTNVFMKVYDRVRNEISEIKALQCGIKLASSQDRIDHDAFIKNRSKKKRKIYVDDDIA
jgi:hypothetical protein